MVATIQEQSPKTTPIININGETPTQLVSWEDFKRKYLSRETKYKYEWVNGTVEKTTRAMIQKQQFIYDNLYDFLYALGGRKIGSFNSEVDTFFLDGVHRRPDIAYFTAEQAALMAHEIEQIPKFVIEIISKNDTMNPVHRKMNNYRDAQVAVVWHIFPELEQIHVYYDKNLSKMVVCEGTDMCSAETVIAGFLMPAQDVFKKPALPNTEGGK
jgi:Uma2 family endonuclease